MPRDDVVRQAFLDARNAVATGDPATVRATRETTKQLLADVYLTRPMKDNKLWHDRATWLDEIFEHENRGALAENKAITVLIKWPRGFFGRIISG